MNQELRKNCDLLVLNRKVIAEAFPWIGREMCLAASCIFTYMGKIAKEKELVECEQIIKSNTKMFSLFRGYIRIVIISKMLLSDDPKAYFLHVKATYEELTQNKTFGSEYEILASILLCDHAKSGSIKEYVGRTHTIYTLMREEHPWLTSREDIPYAALLAVTGQDVRALVDEMENIYRILKSSPYGMDAAQSLSHVMSLGAQSAEEKCDRINGIYGELKKRRHRYGASYELASLGVFTMLDMPQSQIVDELIDADNYLNEHKGFGDILLGQSKRRMYATQMVMSTFSSQIDQQEVNTGWNSDLMHTVAIDVAMISTVTACIITSEQSSAD